MPAPRDVRGRASVRIVVSAALAVLAAAALFIMSFASEETVARLAICQPPQISIAPLTYAGATLTLALVYWAAAAMDRRHTPRRGPAPWLIGVSIAGIIFSGWIATLGIGFWGGGQQSNAAQAVLIGILFVVAFTGPSIASLVAAILMGGARSRAMTTTLLPPLAFLAVTATSVAVVLVRFATSCL